MRRRLTAVALWAVATLLAVGLATAAIGSVTERRAPLADPPPAAVGVAPTEAATAAPARTFEVVGGRVGVRVVDGAVALQWAAPASGFAVDVDDDSEEVDVEFRGDRHRSRLRLWVQDGVLRSQVDEDPR